LLELNSRSIVTAEGHVRSMTHSAGRPKREHLQVLEKQSKQVLPEHAQKQVNVRHAVDIIKNKAQVIFVAFMLFSLLVHSALQNLSAKE